MISCFLYKQKLHKYLNLKYTTNDVLLKRSSESSFTVLTKTNYVMKKLLLGMCVLAGTFYSSAQEMKFGVRAGVDFATVETSVTVPILGTVKAKGSETGFFVGGFASIGITESFAVQPELLYLSIKDANTILVPVLGKYTVAEKINLLAGPSFNYSLDADDDEFKVNVDFGGSYDVTENIDVAARYSLGFGDVKMSGILVGVGYSF